MLQLTIDDPALENYFKHSSDNVISVLKTVSRLNLADKLEALDNELLHRKTLESIREGKVQKYNDPDSLIRALNA